MKEKSPGGIASSGAWCCAPYWLGVDSFPLPVACPDTSDLGLPCCPFLTAKGRSPEHLLCLLKQVLPLTGSHFRCPFLGFLLNPAGSHLPLEPPDSPILMKEKSPGGIASSGAWCCAPYWLGVDSFPFPVARPYPTHLGLTCGTGLIRAESRGTIHL